VILDLDLPNCLDDVTDGRGSIDSIVRADLEIVSDAHLCTKRGLPASARIFSADPSANVAELGSLNLETVVYLRLL